MLHDDLQASLREAWRSSCSIAATRVQIDDERAVSLADAAQQGDIGTQRAGVSAQLLCLGLEAVAYVRALLSMISMSSAPGSPSWVRLRVMCRSIWSWHHASQGACTSSVGGRRLALWRRPGVTGGSPGSPIAQHRAQIEHAGPRVGGLCQHLMRAFDGWMHLRSPGNACRLFALRRSSARPSRRKCAA